MAAKAKKAKQEAAATEFPGQVTVSRKLLIDCHDTLIHVHPTNDFIRDLVHQLTSELGREPDEDLDEDEENDE